MLVNFDSLPPDSRVWIYPSSRLFSEEEVSRLKAMLEDFLTQWTAHNNPLTASYKIPYNSFIVIAVDCSKENVSGCSIDASVHLIQQIEKDFGIALLDKLNVTFWEEKQIKHSPLLDFKKRIKRKQINPKTIVFNNLVDTKVQLSENWEVPITESWHNRFLT